MPGRETTPAIHRDTVEHTADRTAVSTPSHAGTTPSQPSLAEVGRSQLRLESVAKVTGAAEYIHNLRLPGMLHGKIHRSSVAHGRIRHVDASAATCGHGASGFT